MKKLLSINALVVAFLFLSFAAAGANPTRVPRPAAHRQQQCNDPYEPNNSFASAWPLAPGALQSYICCDGTDLDYFAFAATSGDVLQLELRDLPADYDLCLFGPSKNQVTCSQTSGSVAETVEATAPQGGTYYAYVYGAQGACDASNPYTLDLQLTPSCTPVTGATLNGPTVGITDTFHTFTAAVAPHDASPPLTYTWHATDKTQVVKPAEPVTQTNTSFSWSTWGRKQITVTAANCGGTVSATHAITIGRKPDLTITDVWTDNGLICYQIRNLGQGTAPASHLAGLSVDGTPLADHAIQTMLDAGERVNQCFATGWQCSSPKDQVRVCADFQGGLAESDETNNCREETWACDATEPIITTGPVVSETTETTALIMWETDEASDSSVHYGSHAWRTEGTETNAALTKNHQITLTDLTPSTTYHYVVESTDASGNTVESADLLFYTAAAADVVTPTISLSEPGTLSGTAVITATVTDTMGIEKVAFFVDGQLLHTDFSEPMLLRLDTDAMANGEHRLDAEAFDRFGNQDRYTTTLVIGNYPDEYAPDVTVSKPGEGASVRCTVPITVHATDPLLPLNHDRSGIRKVETYLDPPDDWSGFVAPLDTEHYRDDPLPSAVDYVYHWNTRWTDPGEHTLVLRVQDGAFNTTSVTRTVTVDSCAVEEDDIRVWRDGLERQGNTFSYTLVVENVGPATAHGLTVEDEHEGFQPLLRNDADAAVVDVRLGQVTLELGDLPAGASRRVGFHAVPVLLEEHRLPRPTIYAIGLQTNASYRATADAASPEEKDCSAPITAPTLDTAAALRSADYVLLTSISDLLAHYEPDDVHDLVGSMAELAALRDGVIGYVHHRTPASRIKDLIEPGGQWALQLAPSFSEGDVASGRAGYVLIVGETEIVPSWTEVICCWDEDDDGEADDTKTVHFTDQTYADTFANDGAPELVVGRVIGNEVVDLLEPIEASIAVARGSGFDRSFGLVTTGHEYKGWEDFVPQGENVLDVLERQEAEGTIMGDGSEIVHWSAYVHKWETVLGDGYDLAPFAAHDRLLLADTDGSGEDEVVVVEADADRIRVYERDGLHRMVSSPDRYLDIPCAVGDYDPLAAGDVDGDGVDELLVGSLADDTLCVAQLDAGASGGEHAEFSLPFDDYDHLATGDLSEDTREEILITDASRGRIDTHTYDTASPTPELVSQDTVTGVWALAGPNRVAIGEIYPEFPGREIVIAAPCGFQDCDRIYVLDNRGDRITELVSTGDQNGNGKVNALDDDVFDHFSNFDALAVGDSNGDGLDEIFILTARDYDGKRRLIIRQPSLGQRDIVFSRFLNFRGMQHTTGDLMPYDGDEYDSLAAGDLDGDGRAELGLAAVPRSFYILDGDYADGWKPRFMNTLDPLASTTDLFVLKGGHGSATTCSPFGRADIGGLDLGAHPLVFALSCLTGRYELAGEDGFAEAFLDSGAAAYIGTTQVSYADVNEVSSVQYLEGWDAEETAGMALADYERDQAGLTAGWRYWVTEYNFYGDVKFGAVGASEGSAAATGTQNTADAPTPTRQVTIPDYEVETVAGEDVVTIPGGQILLKDGQPRVPYYTAEIEVPTGYQVQDVELLQRTDLTATEGLVLPTVTSLPACSSASTAQAAAAAEGGEWFPAEAFDWQVLAGPEASTLLIHIYPFRYNDLTTAVEFYRQFTFHIEFTPTSVTIEDLETDASTYEPGATVTVDALLNNAGEAQDVVVDAIVARYGSEATADGLLLRTLKGVTGTASVSSWWDSAGSAPGHYAVRLVLRDAGGNTLDVQTQRFQLGTTAAEVTELTVSAERFTAGDPVTIALTVSNTGTVPITGTAVIEVRDSAGDLVADLSGDVPELAPLDELRLEETWDTTSAAAGLYDIVGYMLYDSQSTDTRRVTLGSGKAIYLPLILRGTP